MLKNQFVSFNDLEGRLFATLCTVDAAELQILYVWSATTKYVLYTHRDVKNSFTKIDT